MARTFLVTINYAPEPTGFAPHAAALAEYLTRQGHEVDVFTGFPFAPIWRRRPEDRGRFLSRTHEGALTVHRLTHFIPRRPSQALQRLLMEGSFAALAFAVIVGRVLRRGRPDLLMYIGAQPALAMLTRTIAGLVRRPYLVNVNDLAARAALDVGIVGRPLHRVLDAFEFAAYRGAAGASVLSRSFERALVDHGYPTERIRIIRSPVDIDRIRPLPRDSWFRRAYGIPEDAFVVMHAGSMGRKQGLMHVVRAAGAGTNPRVRWVLVGDGEDRAALVDAAAAWGVDDRVHFVPFQRDTQLSQMFAAADVLLVHQLRAVKDTVIPSKLLTYMAAGRPVLAAVNPASQAAELLLEADGGVLVAPEDPAALGAAAHELSEACAERLGVFGARNRAYAERHFDERHVLAAHERFMLDVLGDTGIRGTAS
jgi:colanic acid biosynthesis glycosyl transferase WcaI